MESAGRQVRRFSHELIRQVYLQGNSSNQTARLVGCSAALVHRVIHTAGIARNREIPREIPRHFPEFVRELLRLAQDIRHTKLSRKIGISHDLISSYYRGASCPSCRTADWLAQAIGYRITLEPIDDTTRKESATENNRDLAKPHNDSSEPGPADQPTL